MNDEEMAYLVYDWLRNHHSGNGYEGHDGMHKVTLDAEYDLVAMVEFIRGFTDTEVRF